ncbi:hypothetical protein VP1G_11452 [Cytospora mali]|uniref:DUF427 domain-containing protein n=1 Tax=Cytospora mali TaxID=578113 RepID=A0A194VG00_CYTMA|nr:hypothetical protein VP1G_11452 [Valsa mali var. pyri (nom. inval.)]
MILTLPGHSPTELGIKLINEGPYKQEPANRRIRGLLGERWIFDTLEAQYVWEHPYFPFYYVPAKAITLGPAKTTKEREDKAGFWLGTIHSGAKTAEVQDWFAEDEKLLGGHPKDPYKRIEILPSTRQVRIEVNGAVVAQSTNNMFLHETMLRTRYYLPSTSINDWSMLSKSDTVTFCPYKGQANYYHLKVGDTEIEDAIWYYVYPTHESAGIQGRLCFYDEKVDVFIDGVQETK